MIPQMRRPMYKTDSQELGSPAVTSPMRKAMQATAETAPSRRFAMFRGGWTSCRGASRTSMVGGAAGGATGCALGGRRGGVVAGHDHPGASTRGGGGPARPSTGASQPKIVHFPFSLAHPRWCSVAHPGQDHRASPGRTVTRQ
jgi:hypothetical protein